MKGAKIAFRTPMNINLRFNLPKTGRGQPFSPKRIGSCPTGGRLVNSPFNKC